MTSIGINSFAHCHLDPAFEGTRLDIAQMKDICALVESMMVDRPGVWDAEGYAPFCRVVTIPLDMLPASCQSLKKTPYARITGDNRLYLLDGYHRRRPGELPILKRWFTGYGNAAIERARYDVAKIEVVLYTREQLKIEGDDYTGCDYDIITVKAERGESSPMCPHTMMVNHLGTGFGGSGVQLDRDAYEKSVSFWDYHAFVGA